MRETGFISFTYSMELSPSEEANSSSASQAIPSILWNPKAHYRVYKFPPPDTMLTQINPVHSPNHFLNIHINIILPSPPRSSKRSPSLRFPHQFPVYTSALPYTCYMPRPSHFSRFDHPKNIWWAVQIPQQLYALWRNSQNYIVFFVCGQDYVF